MHPFRAAARRRQGRPRLRARAARSRRQPCAAGGRPAAQHRRSRPRHAPASSTDERGFITVDERLATNVAGIWALGDCNGRGAFTHTAYNDFEIVAANLLDGDDRKVSDRVPGYALYIDPPLGRAGMSEAEARKSGRRSSSANGR